MSCDNADENKNKYYYRIDFKQLWRKNGCHDAHLSLVQLPCITY